MSKPEENINARAYAYEVLEGLAELITKRAESCLDMEEDCAALLMTVVQDTVNDYKADVARAKIIMDESGRMSVESDVMDFLEQPDEDDYVDQNTLSITLSNILERLEGLEGTMKNMNGESHSEH